MSSSKFSQKIMDLEGEVDTSREQRRSRHRHRGGVEQKITEGTVRLSRVPVGGRCRVCAVRIRGIMRRRLMDLGLVPDAEVSVLRRAPLNDPIEVRIGNAYVALRQEEADRIEVVVL